MIVDAYTDGACSGNPGPGGWGVLLVAAGKEKELCDGEAATTNNRMELTAAIEALNAVKKADTVRIHTDSTYVRDGITQWIDRWKRNGWRTAARKPVKNEDLWRQLDEVAQQHEVSWRWVKGHSGHPENDRADALANRGLDELLDGSAARAMAGEQA